MTRRTFLFAGGGTGGHIYPALAIAEQLVKLDAGARVRVLCSTRAIDAEILSGATLAGRPIEFEAIPAHPFGLSPRTLLRFVSRWGGAVRAARTEIRRAKEETGTVEVVAMGGFVAAPAAQAARAERVPLILVNLDATPGRANRWIAGHAARVLTAARVAGDGGKGWTLIPPIVRRDALAPGDPGECRRRLGLDPARRTLLVTGASQGAQTINRALIRLAEMPAGVLAGWQVVHQTGKEGVEEVRSAYARAGIPARVEAYFPAMGVAWGASEAAISRAGAGSVAEAWANRVPAIFMPYPYHRDQHQRVNAVPLVEVDGAVLLDDAIDADANARALAGALPAFLDSQTLRARRERLASLGPCDGADRVARALLGG